MVSNLLITYDPSHPGKAKEEVNNLLEEVDEKITFEESGIEGVFLAAVRDARTLVRSLVDIFQISPDRFQYTFNWIPIDKWISSDIKVMEEEMKRLNEEIDPKESWKLDVVKRKYEMRTPDLIIKLTEHVDKPKVDLKNPQKIIRVEIIGEKAGISLIDAEEILNIQKMKEGK